MEKIKENIDNFNNLMKERVENSEKLNEHNKANDDSASNKTGSDSSKIDIYNKVTTEDLQKLCDQLSAFNSRVQTAREIIRLRYDLPNMLQERLEIEAGELECLFKELQDSTNNLDIIRNQRKAMSCEKNSMEKQLDKLKSDTIQELEVIVSVYDNNMLQQWESVKSGNSLMAVENFLHDVKGKLQAMKNLQLLGNQKLSELKNEEDKKGQNILKKEKKKRNKEMRANRTRTGCNMANSSQTSLPFILDTDSEDVLDDSAMHNVLYSLVCDQVLSLPAWTQGVMDID